MERYLTPYVKHDLDKKIVLVTGPRQCGKTTLSHQLFPDHDYFNYDSADDRLALKEQSWDRSRSLIVFDEIYKMPQWKRWLKGIYDTEGVHPKILVTGSAKLDTYRKAGDSLAGRYFQYRLHPIDLKEAVEFYPAHSPEVIFDRLLSCSGFPEPFLEGDKIFYQRWRHTHLDIILRQDLLDIQAVRDIQAIETLVALLKRRVGSTISYANLARDLERDANTIKRWLLLLENLYVIFRVTPYHKDITRSLLKEPKFYFYDTAQVIGDEGAQFENLVACALLKELHFREDTKGINTNLHFMRTKDGKELDFLITMNETPTSLIEVKWSDSTPAPSFQHFQKFLPEIQRIQLVRNLERNKTYPNGLTIQAAIPWLTEMALRD